MQQLLALVEVWADWNEQGRQGKQRCRGSRVSRRDLFLYCLLLRGSFF
jgi:hypothetical protein